MNTLIFKINDLLDKPTGTSIKYSFKGPVKFEGIPEKSEIEGDATIMKIDEGVNLSVEKVNIEVEFQCEKCLDNYVKKIHIDQTERQFLLEKPKKVEDQEDLFLIDKKKLEIDATEMLRQEIILHFPVVSVCSKHCKGLCPVCGKNRNKEKCDCRIIEETPENKPLKQLKDLIKE